MKMLSSYFYLTFFIIHLMYPSFVLLAPQLDSEIHSAEVFEINKEQLLEEDSRELLIRRRQTHSTPKHPKQPDWSPVFPGNFGDRENEDEYITTYKPRTTPSSAFTSTTTIPPTTTKKLPWYKRLKSYAKNQYHHISEKLG